MLPRRQRAAPAGIDGCKVLGLHCIGIDMTTPTNYDPRTVLIVTLAAAATMAITTGSRQSMGVFISPINTATSLRIASISCAFAIGQLLWGAAQPGSGPIADNYASRPAP